MSKIRKLNRASHQIKEEQIIFLLEVVQKTQRNTKKPQILKKNGYLTLKKILVSAKNSYDKTVAENQELKAYIQNIKERFQDYQQQQQTQVLENQRNYYKKKEPKRYKKVVYEEEPESDPEPEEEEDEEIEEEPEIKNNKKKGSKKEKVTYFTT